MLPELDETTKKLDVAPNTLAIDCLESLPEGTDVEIRYELRDDWGDWLSGYTKRSCINYLKVFAPRQAVGRLYLYTHPNGDYIKYELYLGSKLPEDTNA